MSKLNKIGMIKFSCFPSVNILHLKMLHQNYWKKRLVKFGLKIILEKYNKINICKVS